MKKVDVVSTHDLDELAIDVLQSFVVGFQRIYQPWATVQNPLG